MVAIEASPMIYQALQRNLALNNGAEPAAAAPIRTINMAVSDVAGTVRMHHGPAFQLSDCRRRSIPGNYQQIDLAVV